MRVHATHQLPKLAGTPAKELKLRPELTKLGTAP